MGDGKDSSQTTAAETTTRPGGQKVDKKRERAALLDNEGDLSALFTQALSHIFQRFSHAAQEYVASTPAQQAKLKRSKSNSFVDNTIGLSKLVLTEKELDEFAKAVNGGEVMNESSKEEMKEYLDVDKDGNLTFIGFCEMYHLQSGSDADETWKDLKALGYDDQLQFLQTSSEDSKDA